MPEPRGVRRQSGSGDTAFELSSRVQRVEDGERRLSIALILRFESQTFHGVDSPLESAVAAIALPAQSTSWLAAAREP